MTTRTKPRRRWFQFSLRTLMVLVAVLCVCLALTVNAARKQREAVGGSASRFLWAEWRPLFFPLAVRYLQVKS